MRSPSSKSPQLVHGANISFAWATRCRYGWGWLGVLLLCSLSLLPGIDAEAQRAGQTVLATTVPLARPSAIAFDASGNLYLAETNHHAVVKVDPSGNLTTIAGTGVQGFAGDGGPATAAMLDSPTGLALDAAGDVYVADSHNQRVRRIDAISGVITTIAGDGTAGYSGDGGPGTAAALNRPGALAVDAAGNVYIADTNNHRVRCIDAQAGSISTVAGDGVQGYSGDGGPAVAAEIDSPDGLAVSAAGVLYLADTHNQRIRAVNLAAGTGAAGIITTIAGTGVSGSSGDVLAAAQAALAGPRGLTVDAQGNLYLADTNNQRIRRIDATTGAITTVVGTGTQGFLGDGSAATAAALDSPRAVALAPAGANAAALTLADTGNRRVRQVANDATVQTIAGLGGAAAGTLTLAAPSVVSYGTGAVTATLQTTTAATGAVTFLDVSGASPVTLGSIGLSANAATESLASLNAGSHTLIATYAGDATHQAATSTAATIDIRSTALIASANPMTTSYGAPLPTTLTGSVSGLLAQDAGRVMVNFSTSATVASAPGSYPIVARISGAAAANYQLSLAADSGQFTIARAPVTVSLTALANAFAVGAPESFTAQVISTTSGTPTGSATLFDGSTALQTSAISSGGVAVFTISSLAAGTHTLTASYTGSADYRTATSQPFVATVGGGGSTPAADFTLTAAGTTSATVQSGSSTAFAFNITEQGGGMASPILLAASGLPIGAVASFSPAQIPPGTASANVTLTIQTPNAPPAAVELFHGRHGGLTVVFAVMLCPLWLVRRRIAFGSAGGRGANAALLVGLALLLASATGCGNRVYSTATTTQSTTYTITVSATATGANGSVLSHSTTVLLTVQ